MKIIRFDVELRGNKDVLLNDRLAEDPRAVGEIEEKIVTRQLTLDQQWIILTSLKRLSAQLEDCYRQARLRAGDGGTTKKHTAFSGMTGVPGTDLPSLLRKP